MFVCIFTVKAMQKYLAAMHMRTEKEEKFGS